LPVPVPNCGLAFRRIIWADYPWMWTITGAVVAPRLPSHGFCASLDEAKAKFAETWRAWVSGVL